VRLLRFSIGEKARVGLSVIIADEVELGENASVGHFNLIKHLDYFKMKESSIFGSFNWMCGSPGRTRGNASRSGFILGRSSAVTSRHFLDAQYTIHIGEFSTIAGVRSTIFSHSMDLYNCKQGGSPVVIGDYVFVGSNALILPGVNIADRVIVGAGATLAKVAYESDMIYLGASGSVKEIDRKVMYFDRKSGFVK